MGNLNLLLIDDSEDTRDLVLSALGPHQIVEWSSTVTDAHSRLNSSEFGLILLDVSLPDGNGFHFYRTLKSSERNKNTPVIFLTGHDSVEDKVRGISLGADDYITKPFSSVELRARVEMRIEKELQRSTVLQREEIRLNLADQKAVRLQQEQEVDLQLTPLEFRLLVLFFNNEGQTLSRDILQKRAWGENISLTDRAVDTHICSLRKKLGERAAWIQSIYGEGYRLDSRG